MYDVPINELDQHVSEAESLIDLITFIEELSEDDRSRLRPATITLLHLLGELLHKARRNIGTIQQINYAA